MSQPEPHSREWYAALARELGDYQHPWRRELDGPDPELTYNLMLADLLENRPNVLEAGCGGGRDAARFSPLASSWKGYDREPGFLETARQRVPASRFIVWDGKGEVPAELRGPFDLIVSRRGPTSVINHLPAVAAPNARFLYVGPKLDVPAVPERLAAVGWTVTGEWRVRVRAWLPSEADDTARAAFMGETHDPARWQREAGVRGRAYWEERYIVLAAQKNDE
ncbi:class I SAM-dependent methyltransferase [Deinococcus sp.]|uniref:class I SAM-dependent methyltransferase n=1 Tax=Deinococcus sp. TaxID=47478 RepID=UPI003B58BE19